jgi:putative DNA primase/helicase
MVYPDRPWWIKIHGHSGLRFLDLVNGGQRPKGEEFAGAVRRLCELAGVPFVQREQTEQELEQAHRLEGRRAVLEDTYHYCETVLWSPEGQGALRYLQQGRGLLEEAIRAFGLGLLLSAAALRKHLRHRGHAEEDVKDAGVLWRRLEGYITIPWRDARGQALTIYGRWQEKTPPLMKDVPTWRPKRDALRVAWEKAREEKGQDRTSWKEDPVPKTIALPGKGTKAVPFCLDLARKAGHRELVLVEGVFDALALQAAGETRAVASVAAQLSGDQLLHLARCRLDRVFV